MLKYKLTFLRIIQAIRNEYRYGNDLKWKKNYILCYKKKRDKLVKNIPYRSYIGKSKMRCLFHGNRLLKYIFKLFGLREDF